MNMRDPATVPGTPVTEFSLNSQFVTGLLEDQHPDLAHLPLRGVEAGWDNALFIEFLQPGGSTSSRAAATAVELQFAL
jgi:hypothetical protein